MTYGAENESVLITPRLTRWGEDAYQVWFVQFNRDNGQIYIGATVLDRLLQRTKNHRKDFDEHIGFEE
ncbi:hypothetical protein NPIL_565971 [Nephila pilipes]|uniref:Uncharacterized protein n=1 Tax=Nephila pilipes TaxID=299642 RepID=A0A8X6QZF9_NEPPI|nr:hypothetical protein NPIL_565971 [Nephila pilipes]